MKKLVSAILCASAVITAEVSPGAVQYWDKSTTALYQYGDGTWSTAPEDANWSSTGGTALGPWTNGNDATFAAFGGSSIVTLNTSLTTGVAYVTGSGYAIIVTNGGRIVSTSTVAIGNANGANDNRVTVAGGAGVTSSWSTLIMKVGATTSVGTTNNLVVVDGKGVPGSAVMSNTTLAVGASVGNAGNELRVVAGGRLFTSTTSTIGSVSTGNTVRVLGAGSQWDLGGGTLVVGVSDGSGFNSLVLDEGARAFNAGVLNVGNAGSASNELRIFGGASLYTAGSSTSLGNYSTGNLVRVSGPGSQWICNGGTLNMVGYSNVLSVEDSAMASNAGAINLGGAGSYSNEVRVSGGGLLMEGGTLTVGVNASMGNSLQLRGAGSRLIAAALTVGTGVSGPLNSFLVDDRASAVLSGALVVGSAANFNSMLITNGGLVTMSSTVNVGTGGTSNKLAIIGNAGAPSILDAGGQSVTVGHANGTLNLLLVDGQGAEGSAVLTNGGSLGFGYGVVAVSGNVIRVANGGVAYITGATIGSANGAYPALDNSMEFLDGAKVYSSGSITVCYAPHSTLDAMLTRNRLVVRGATTLLAMNGGSLTVGAGTSISGSISNNECWIEGALVTNVGSVRLAAPYSGVLLPKMQGNTLTVTNGGRLYSTLASEIAVSSSTGNVITVTGANSLWKLGSQALTIGNSTTTASNQLVIDQGGAVDEISVLSVRVNNSVVLRGGTLGVGTWTNTVAFVAGDGAQAATLKGLGGSLLFNAGLRINTNAMLTGIGVVSGAGAGVLVANGAALAPGSNGVGLLTIGGSNLTWVGGGSYRCEITDMKLGPGVGWDMVNVSSQLVMSGSGLVIKMDSMGAPAANFDSTRNYNLRILSYGSQAGYNPANVTVNANDFKNGGTWTVTNAANSLWLVYRGASSLAAADYTWKAPSNGNWDVAANWAGASAPAAAGGASLKVAFGDTGVAYRSTNNLGGAFQLNQLRFSSGSGVTNFLLGNQLALTNTGARLDYVAGENGAFTVSNAVRLTTDTEFGGDAFGGTLSLAGPVTNLGTLTKRGTWTLALSSANNDFSGPIVLDGAGVVRADVNSAVNGAGDIVVSNGLFTTVETGTPAIRVADGRHNRRILVSGSGSTWSNVGYLVMSSAATNVSLIVDGGQFYSKNMLLFQAGSEYCLLQFTNGATANNGTANIAVGDASSNCRLIGTGSGTTMYFDNALYAGFGGGVSNSILFEKGARARGSNNFKIWAGNGNTSRFNSVTVANGGITSAQSIFARGCDNTVLISGTGTTAIAGYTGGLLVGGVGAEHGNTMTIADQAVVSNYCLNWAQEGAYANALTVTNGGKMFSSVVDAFVAAGVTNSYSNRLIITGSGSVWNQSAKSMTVCSGTGTLNQLSVEAGGLMTNLLTLIVAIGSGASNNNVTVNGGTLVAGTITCSNTLPNSVIATNGGTLTATTLLTVTNANFKVNLNGGTLNVKSTLVDNGAAFVAGDGSLNNTLNLVPGGTHTFVNGLVVTNGTTLAGSGLVQATSTVYGVLSPGGVGLGSVTNNGLFTLTNSATARFELAANTAPGAGWDLLAVTNGALNLGGTLVPVLKGAFLPAQADRFLIMTNQGPSTVSGEFSNGSRATIYAENLTTKVGTFKIEKGTQGVVLTDYQILRSSGTLIFVR